MEISEPTTCGKELGLKGAALKEWVDQERGREGTARAQEKERSIEVEYRSLLLKIRMQEFRNDAAHLQREEGRNRCITYGF